jgi:4-hydroxybenzoate polyprenyltransferase
VITAGFLGAAALQAAAFVRPSLGVVAGSYLILLLLYSAFLKHMVIIDVLTIAAGFVVRAVGGAVAVAVPISHWLLVCTTLLALFLVLSKRRHEYLLDQMVGVVTASTLVAYAIYATSAETAERLGTDRLGLTIPFVLYGIFRYLYLVHQRRGGGSPSALLLTDRPLLVCVALWTASVVLILYTPFGR